MKFKISLAENYNLPGPFVTDWNVELIGDKLREEFDVYLENHKKDIKYVEGSSKALIVPLILQRFMNLKKISLVEDPASGGLISRFVLKKDEVKMVDERAAKALHVFKRREVLNSQGEFESWLGFINIDQIGKPKIPEGARVIQNVIGEDVNYFEEEKAEEKEESPNEEPAPSAMKAKTIMPKDVPQTLYYCDKCKRGFKNKGILTLHMRTHKSKV